MKYKVVETVKSLTSKALEDITDITGYELITVITAIRFEECDGYFDILFNSTRKKSGKWVKPVSVFLYYFKAVK